MAFDYDAILTPASHLVPRHFVPPGAWNGHAPFAGWLIEALQPGRIVELGSQWGFSTFAMAEAARQLGVPAVIDAIDTWQGEDHAGEYGEEVYLAFMAIAAEYPSVNPRRMTFAEAVDSYEDGSIDLLHIDGRHGYEDVKDDFRLYQPKLSDRAVVLFHDAAAYRESFGVYRFWQEIAADYPAFRFTHSWGLGVLGYGRRLPAAVRRFFAQAADNPQEVRSIYEFLAWDMDRERKFAADPKLGGES